ncbi:MAG: alpha-L-fucosidase [Mucilaginibacter sp.]|nr:alpha-L-fucosidase [Mucilaginibacter sp.]
MNSVKLNTCAKKTILLIGVFLLMVKLAVCQNYSYPMPDYTPTKENLESREMFKDMKFGMFIHWGIYSLLGDGEWVMHNEHIPYKNYKRLAGFFNPEQFNAQDIVGLAKAAGMKYITITSRHHDGFSMFNTKASDYNIVEATPYHKDPLKELADECHKQGIKLFFYYSLLDWGRPDYGFGHPIVNGKPIDADWDHYIAFMKQQLTELLTNYGSIAGIWFDGEWERRDVNWHFDEIYGLIHKLQPAAMIGNNHHIASITGEDFQMFEKDLPGENTTGFSGGSVISHLPLETCETMNNGWGFTLNDNNYKSVTQIIHLLVNDAGRNANLLLNIGPMPNGKVQPEFIDTLRAVGEWMNKNGETIRGTRGGLVAPQEWGIVTEKNKTLYVHILKNTGHPFIFIPKLKLKVTKASAFADNTAITFKQLPEGVFVYLDKIKPDQIDTIVKLETL